MGILLSVISLLYLILIFMAKYIPYPNGPLHLFQFILLLNMLMAGLSTHLQIIPWTTIVLSLGLLLYLAIRQQEVLRHDPNGRYFVQRLTFYIGAISCLCIGSGLLASLVPSYISLLFQLLYSSALAFLLSFPAFLYFSWYLREIPPKHKVDTLVVLGAGIFSEEVSPLLKARLDAAYAIHQPSTHWIVSGGQGADEPISEALAMQRYLISLGVPASQVTLEDRSTNTHENMVFSKPFMQSKTKCVVVTSDFHLLRALRIAQRVGIVANGYGALSPLRYRARSYIRDYCGLLLHHPYAWGIFIVLQLVTTLIN